MEYTIEQLNEKYDLELDKVVAQIKKEKAKLVLLQFPDGLKVYATAVVDYLKEKTNSNFLIWLGTCFGACDTPNLGKMGTVRCTPNCGVRGQERIDLTIQFGHNEVMPQY
jgi:diphthamide biosynthesis enzyme Dph1/Dph2-like protein